MLPDESLKKFQYARQYHTLTPVVDPNITNGRELTRLIWNTPLLELIRKPTVTDHGMYMFGGMNEKGHPTEDLFWITPDMVVNSKNISTKNGEFKEGPLHKAEVRFQAKKIVADGRAPIARSQHSATYFKDYLVIYGGRNDAIYPLIKNVAMNDLHIYEVALNKWATIAIYGNLPGSRWGHRLVANETKIVLFGGMNLGSYCESVLYDIHIGK